MSTSIGDIFNSVNKCENGAPYIPLSSKEGRKEGRKEGTCLFDINIKHNTEIFIGKIISGDSH